MFFKKKTREDYRAERKALYQERARLLAEESKRSKYQARVNYRKKQTANLKHEIRELKYGKYKKAVSLVGKDFARIGKPIGRTFAQVGRKIATPTQADMERAKRGQKASDLSDVIGTTWTGKKTSFDYGGDLTKFGVGRQHREHHKKRKRLLEGIPN